MRRRSEAMSSAPSAWLAPACSTMRFSPAVRRITATPVEAPGRRRTRETSAPAPARPRTSVSPKPSSPTAAIMRTSAPSRAAATAWLAPFPPAAVMKPDPASVSPASGTRGASMDRSMFMLPKTITFGMAASSRAVRALFSIVHRRLGAVSYTRRAFGGARFFSTCGSLVFQVTNVRNQVRPARRASAPPRSTSPVPAHRASPPRASPRAATSPQSARSGSCPDRSSRRARSWSASWCPGA